MLSERTVVLLELPTRQALDNATKSIQQSNKHMKNATLIRMMVKYCLTNEDVFNAVLEQGDPTLLLEEYTYG
jgi:hypothetical protein